ncbi:hypothetical protein SAMN05216315_13220 [Nitrosospira sp. Nsp18]|nr:hypothetical protein SAMN05216315_13220 [Nitrosospira sp. Nsp18]
MRLRHQQIIQKSREIQIIIHITSPDLRDNVRGVVDNNPTQAFRLVEVSQTLEE